MNSRVLPRFWAMYGNLPASVRREARRAYQRFSDNPAHPSLHFKPLRGFDGFWSVRITLSYRAVCHREGETVTWVWIGSHADFDRQFG